MQEPGFERSLPIIPERVTSVNFTWRSSEKKTYTYEILDLDSYDRSVLKVPTLSMPLQGVVPKNTTGKVSQQLTFGEGTKNLSRVADKEKFSISEPVFTVGMECLPNNTGSADLSMAFTIRTEDGRPLKGMPMKFILRKQCLNNGEQFDTTSSKCPSLGKSSNGSDHCFS